MKGKRVEEFREIEDEPITVFCPCKTINQIRDLRTDLSASALVNVHPWLRENVLLSLMSQSEKEYCLEMTNENARMRRILGRLRVYPAILAKTCPPSRKYNSRTDDDKSILSSPSCSLNRGEQESLVDN